MRRILRAVLAGAVAALAVAAPAGPALAHDALRSSNPKDGATLDAAPAAITLTYTANVLELGSRVRVTGPDGAAVDVGAVQVVDETVTAPLPAGLAAGDYQVRWQVTSSDGHPIAGEFGFALSAAAAPTTAPPTTAPPTSAPAAAAPTTGSPADSVAPEPTDRVEATSAESGVSGGAVGVFVGITVLLAALVLGAAVLARRQRARAAERAQREDDEQPVP